MLQRGERGPKAELVVVDLGGSTPSVLLGHPTAAIVTRRLGYASKNVGHGYTNIGFTLQVSNGPRCISMVHGLNRYAGAGSELMAPSVLQ